MTFYIRKSSGEKQRFDLHKFRRSLFKAGASEKQINEIIKQVKKSEPKSTKQIHNLATEILQKKAPAVADRYNLKRALMELGPHGYSFEQFIAQLFVKLGFKADTNVVTQGACVAHEVDVVVKKNNHHYMVECKFHNKTGMKSDVKVALYMQARFEDIQERWAQSKRHANEFHQVWIVTNTKFTTQAMEYATCKGMKLISWDYPKKGNLAELITKYDLFPITTLTSLNRWQKRQFLKQGLVLCKDAAKHKNTLQKLGFKPSEIKHIIAEAQAVCKL